MITLQDKATHLRTMFQGGFQTCKWIVKQWKQLPGLSVSIVSLLLLVLFIPQAASAVEEISVSGHVINAGKRIELTNGAAYQEQDMVVILLTDKAIPKGRGRAFVDRFLEGTGLRGIAVALKPPNVGTAGAPTLVYVRYFFGDGTAAYSTRPSSFFLLDGVSVLPEQVTGRFHGTIVDFPEEITTDVSFKVLVTEPLAPKPLPKDGGEPGKAFLRIVEALRAKDIQAVKKLCVADVREILMDDQEGAERFMQYLTETYMGEEVRILGGTQDIDRAELEIEVVNKEQIESENVFMALEGDEWKLDE